MDNVQEKLRKKEKKKKNNPPASRLLELPFVNIYINYQETI